MSDEDDLTFRDKAAIEILQAMITRDKTDSWSATNGFISSIDYVSSSDKKEAEDRMLRLVRAAYRIADLMRKVRLEVFA